MGSRTHIEWTDVTWNPVTGCTKVSQGCKHCYAERMARRLQAMGSSRYANGFRVTLHPDVLTRPLHWVKPRRIFVNSMSDVFHPDVPDAFIAHIFSVMAQTPQHTYQILTKRPERMANMAPYLPFPPNLWVGTSVESQDVVQRIEWLRLVPAHVRFLSCEPLLGPLPKLSLNNIHWVIVGGESGPNARPMAREWVIEIRDQCISQGVPFFFKQWGGTQRTRAGRLLDGRTWDEFPGPFQLESEFAQT
ncbi:MAG: phage Gp37/Gp68 family protein [Firmicutes bacterium]|nr:phage Gp37/Gp68 family protein [Bacillota bacterium]